MILKSKTVSAFIFSMLVSNLLYAENININSDELQSFSLQKYRVDFNAQTEKSKKDIANQFIQNNKLANVLLSGDMKDDVNFKIASEIIVVDMWIQKYLQNVQVDEKTLKSLYEKNEITVTASYKLRNILVDNESKADKLIAAIKRKAHFKNPQKRLKVFKEYVKKESKDLATRHKDGDSGWVDITKYPKNMQKALKGTKVNYLRKLEVKDLGWQILLIEGIKPEHKASFEEARERLLFEAKKIRLQKKIDSILKP